MPAFLFFDKFPGRLGDGTLDLNSHELWAYLTDNQPNKALDNYKSDLAGLGSGNGYLTEGLQMSNVTWVEQAGSPQGLWVFDCDNFSWTASGGSIGPARYLVFYIKGAGSPNEFLVGYVDYGAEFTITDTNSLNVTVTDALFDLGAV